MYLGHRRNWLDYSHGLLTFLHLATLWLSEKGQIWGFRAFLEERIKRMAWNFLCRCILTTLRPDWFMVTGWWFFKFWQNLAQWNRSNLVFPGTSWKTHRGNGLTICMPMYLHNSQNCLVCGHGLLIYLILAIFWLSERVKFEVSGHFWGTQGGNDLKFCMLLYPGHLHEWLDYGNHLVIILILALFDLMKRAKVGVSRHFSGNAWREWREVLQSRSDYGNSLLIFSNFGAILS